MTRNNLKLNTAVIGAADARRKVFLAAFAVFLISLSLYSFFIGQTIFNIVERRQAEAQMRSLSSSLSRLEAEYMSAISGINLSLASDLGFKEAKNVHFASRRGAVGVLYNKADEL